MYFFEYTVYLWQRVSRIHTLFEFIILIVVNSVIFPSYMWNVIQGAKVEIEAIAVVIVDQDWQDASEL